jgi:hypothetical protein
MGVKYIPHTVYLWRLIRRFRFTNHIDRNDGWQERIVDGSPHQPRAGIGKV